MTVTRKAAWRSVNPRAWAATASTRSSHVIGGARRRDEEWRDQARKPIDTNEGVRDGVTEHKINLYDVDPAPLFLPGPRDEQSRSHPHGRSRFSRLLDMYDAFRSEI